MQEIRSSNPPVVTGICDSNKPCKCFWAFSGNFIVRFSGNEFLKDCSGHHSVKGHVWEKAYLLSYGSKSY